MPEDTVIVGLVLLALVPVVAWDAIGSLRAGFDSAFWAQPLEGKLEHIPDQRDAWHRLGIAWVPITVLLGAGFTAFTFQLAEAGEGAWGGLGLGAFLVAAAAFLPAVLFMVTTIADAADVRKRTAETPAWAQPAWRASWWVERGFIIGANLAYVAWGVGAVRSGFPADWVGWLAITSGALIAAWTSFSEYFFQHMVLITPIALGIALVLY